MMTLYQLPLQASDDPLPTVSHLSSLGEQDAVALDVPVNHPTRVQVLECLEAGTTHKGNMLFLETGKGKKTHHK